MRSKRECGYWVCRWYGCGQRRLESLDEEDRITTVRDTRPAPDRSLVPQLSSLLYIVYLMNSALWMVYITGKPEKVIPMLCFLPLYLAGPRRWKQFLKLVSLSLWVRKRQFPPYRDASISDGGLNSLAGSGPHIPLSEMMRIGSGVNCLILSSSSG